MLTFTIKLSYFIHIFIGCADQAVVSFYKPLELLTNELALCSSFMPAAILLIPSLPAAAAANCRRGAVALSSSCIDTSCTKLFNTDRKQLVGADWMKKERMSEIVGEDAERERESVRV